MKNANLTPAQIRRKEKVNEAVKRHYARKKAQANGELIGPELAIRCLQKDSLKVENFKVDKDGVKYRMSRNGGNAVAITMHDTHTGERTRKSYKDIQTAALAFRALVK
jgi:hypothetical protein